MHISDMLNPERRPEPTFQQKTYSNTALTSAITPRTPSTNPAPLQMGPVLTSQHTLEHTLQSTPTPQIGVFSPSSHRHQHASDALGGGGGLPSYHSGKITSTPLPSLSSTGLYLGNDRWNNNPYTTESAEAKTPLSSSRPVTQKSAIAQYHPPMVASSDPMFKSTGAYTSPPIVNNHIPSKSGTSVQTSLSALAAVAVSSRPSVGQWELAGAERINHPQRQQQHQQHHQQQQRESYDMAGRYQHQHAPGNMDLMGRPLPQTVDSHDIRYQPRVSATYASVNHNYPSNPRDHHNPTTVGNQSRTYHNHNVPQFQSHARIRPQDRTPSPTITSPISPSHGSGESPVPAADEMHKCSYMDNCETGSPLRKVVSHFFGRNKLATRKIPMHLWVYFCRKHYQRSRYRNPRGFATLQIQLVQTQIENLQEWGGVVDWTIKVRRREELRSRTAGTQMPEHITPLEMDGLRLDDSVRAGGRGTAHRRRGSGGGGSIPSHYLMYVGEHKTTDQVRALVADIRANMEQNGGTFPDLELLPRLLDENPANREENDPDIDNARGRKFGKQGASRSNTVKRSSRPSISYGPSSMGPTFGNSDNYPTAMKRKSGDRTQSDEDAQSPNSEESAYGPETMSCPGSPSKRPKLFCQATEEGTMPHPVSRSLSQRQKPHHQTMTPPPSASSVSRRASVIL